MDGGEWKKDCPNIPCPEYNSLKGCKRERCKWGHICWNCGGEHARQKCTVVPEVPQPQVEVPEESVTETRKEDTKEIEKALQDPSTPQIIQIVLKAKSHFEVLGLPLPIANDIGNPIWDVTAEQVKDANRKMMLKTHPDKNKGVSIAAAAFAAVQKAFNILSDENERDPYLKSFVDKLEKDRSASWEPPAADVDIEKALSEEVGALKNRKELLNKHFSVYKANVMGSLAARVRAAQKPKRKKEPEPVLSSDSDKEEHESIADKIRAKKKKKNKRLLL